MKKSAPLLVQDENGKYLILERDHSFDSANGCGEFPGGKLDLGELAAAAAQRELREETGIEAPPHDRLYKGGFKAPEHWRREAAQMAAMLESADEQFARFVHQLDAYVGHYAAHLSPAQRRRGLQLLDNEELHAWREAAPQPLE